MIGAIASKKNKYSSPRKFFISFVRASDVNGPEAIIVGISAFITSTSSLITVIKGLSSINPKTLLKKFNYLKINDIDKYNELVVDKALDFNVNSKISAWDTVNSILDEAKKEGKFMSIDDMKIRSKIGKSVIELLDRVGCLKGMSQSNQMSLFG